MIKALHCIGIVDFKMLCEGNVKKLQEQYKKMFKRWFREAFKKQQHFIIDIRQ